MDDKQRVQGAGDRVQGLEPLTVEEIAAMKDRWAFIDKFNQGGKWGEVLADARRLLDEAERLWGDNARLFEAIGAGVVCPACGGDFDEDGCETCRHTGRLWSDVQREIISETYGEGSD